MALLRKASAFAEILEARRARFNAQFAEARLFRPTLDPAAFKAHLAGVVAPIVEAVATAVPERSEAVAEALYDLSLDLVGRDVLGPHARYPAVAQGWTELLPALPTLLAEDPRRLAGAVTNALHQLGSTPGARPGEWVREVLALAPLCAGTDELLQAAQVAAWRAGLAHYRQSALAVCAQLPPAVAWVALGLPGGASDVSPAAAIERLQADPWLHPAEAARGRTGEQRLALVARVGAFRGFGGVFIAPPTVAAPGGQFVVSDGEAHWLLSADLFGATLHRIDKPGNAPPQLAAPLFKVNSGGKVSRGKLNAHFPELNVTLSRAANATTLAVTTPLSHAVYLIAAVSADGHAP